MTDRTFEEYAEEGVDYFFVLVVIAIVFGGVTAIVASEEGLSHLSAFQLVAEWMLIAVGTLAIGATFIYLSCGLLGYLATDFPEDVRRWADR